MKRQEFKHAGLTFSYLDSGGTAPILICLPALWMEAVTYMPLAVALAPEWRVIALDQRGHGYSDHAASYSRDDYIGDLLALINHLRLDTVPVLGNSIGGHNALQFAARYPDKVSALIIEESSVVESNNIDFVKEWAGYFSTQKQLEEAIGERLTPYLESSFRHTAQGWKLAFNPDDMVESNSFTNGDFWQDWLASRCPTLLIRGLTSPLSDPALYRQMANRRANTCMVGLKGGHVVHEDNPKGFAAEVKMFLQNPQQFVDRNQDD